MKISLDECVPIRLRQCLPDHEVHSAPWAGFAGKRNGELMRAAANAGYAALLTVDQGLPFQRPSEVSIPVIVLRAASNEYGDLAPLATRILEAIACIAPGEVVYVEQRGSSLR